MLQAKLSRLAELPTDISRILAGETKVKNEKCILK